MINFVDKTPSYSVSKNINKEITEVTFDSELDLIPSSISKVVEQSSPKEIGKTASFKLGLKSINQGDIIQFDNNLTSIKYRVLSSQTVTANQVKYANITYEELEGSKTMQANLGDPVFVDTTTKTACIEIPRQGGEKVHINDYKNVTHTVPDFNTFDEIKTNLPFVGQDSILKFFAKTPGSWGNSLRVSILNVNDFNAGKELISGISIDSQFDYIPFGHQFAVVVLMGDLILEKYIVSLNELEKNEKNEFIFVETVINQKSNYVLVAVNEAVKGMPETIIGSDVLYFNDGQDSPPGFDDIINAYNVFENKEEIDVDIVIANESYIHAATNLAINRADCIAFVGAPKDVSVGLKSVIANQKVLDYRKTLNIDSKYVMLVNNYKYQYCADMGGYRWINFAGDIAGLKAQTNFNQDNWFAAAGLNRGLIKNVTKTAYSANNSQRDQLYKNGINPIVVFPNTGAVLWGQKTLQTKASSFDRVNVVSLFNYLERALGRMSKYGLFEFNDSFTRNYIVSLIKPFLAQVKAGRGITDYLVICDESNNPPEVVANNELVISCYIKPNFSAEFITLTFTNVGANDFKVVVGS